MDSEPAIHVKNGHLRKIVLNASKSGLVMINAVFGLNFGIRSCKFYYHMDCVAPPLQAKPAKGYSWMCSPCNRARLLNLPPPAVNSSAGRPKGSKNRDINLNRIDYDKPDANFRGWNFRYFGYAKFLFLSLVADRNFFRNTDNIP